MRPLHITFEEIIRICKPEKDFGKFLEATYPASYKGKFTSGVQLPLPFVRLCPGDFMWYGEPSELLYQMLKQKFTYKQIAEHFASRYNRRFTPQMVGGRVYRLVQREKRYNRGKI